MSTSDADHEQPETPETAPPERAQTLVQAAGRRGTPLLERAVRSARRTNRLLRWAGWCSFALIFIALLVEHFPGLESMAAKGVQSNVDSPLTQHVEVDEIDVLWLRREVALRKVALGHAGDELMADEIRLRIGWSFERGLHLDRIAIRGGGLKLTQELVTELSRAQPATGEERSTDSAIDLLARSPEVVVRDFSLDVELPSGEDLNIGRVDVCMRRRADEIASISGRLLPRIVGPDEDRGVIWLNGTLGQDQIVRVDGIAHALEIEVNGDTSESQVPGGVIESIARFRPEARIDLVAEAEFDIRRSVLPYVSATMSVSNGRFVLPWLTNNEERPVEKVEIALAAAFDPQTTTDPFDPEGWSVRGTIEADWESIRGTAGVRVGGDATPDYLFELWADLPNAPIGKRLGELAADTRAVVEIGKMLRPEGAADVSIGVRIPRGLPEGADVGRSMERIALIRPNGGASLSYYGGIDRRTGLRNVGFPLPVNRVAGDVSWSIRPEGRYPGQLGLYDLRGYHAGGPVDVQGSLHFTPFGHFADRSLAELVPAPFHLRVSSQGLAVDEEFERGIRGLSGIPEVAKIIPTYHPSGGQLHFDLELWRTVHQLDLSMRLDAKLDGIGFRWNAFEIPIESTDGNLVIETDGGGPEHGHASVLLDLDATSRVARDTLTVQGRVAAEGILRSASWFQIELGELNTRSSDLRAELARKAPEALAALDASGAAGFVDVSIHGVQSIPELEAAAIRARDPARFGYVGGVESWAEVTPSDPVRGLQLQPQEFPIVTRAARGRLVATTLFPPLPPVTPGSGERQPISTAAGDQGTALGPRVAATRIAAAVQGLWRQTGPSVPVVGRIEAASNATATLTAYGAGLDVSSRSLLGALTNVARTSSTSGGTDPIDTDTLQVKGRVDFGASFELPEAAGMPMGETRIGVDARLDKLGMDGDQFLSDVTAHLRFDDASGRWFGEAIDARLGTTPVQLRDVVWTPDETGSTFAAEIRAEGLPIDRDHLRFFLDPTTLRTVLDDLRMSGTFSIVPGRLVLRQGRDGSTSVQLDGNLRIEDAFVDLGVPVEIAHTESIAISIAHEGRGLRARASVEGLFGAIAGRRLERANLQLTYVEPRLVIEALTGDLEGGKLTAIGGERARGADLFSIDLLAPFPFRLAADLKSVDIGKFLRGMFDSDFANRGTMDLSMRLAGDFEHLTKLEGDGEIHITESALWAIPVFQALSASLGIDTTVTFREMDGGYRIDDGALVFDWMRINSDLLSLVGTGSFDFEGDVTSDLEVRYDLVDRLGPFTRLLYYIQNSLLRVSVRGTMERPTVVLRGLISQFFAPSEERDRLPLPGFSERPRRF